MKESKALEPSPKQKVLGVLMEVQEIEIVLRPHPTRCTKVIAIINNALQHNRLTNDEAQRLAGKLVFLTSYALWPTRSCSACPCLRSGTWLVYV